MPQLILELTDQENADLESVAQERQQSPQDAARDFVTERVAEEMKKSPNARARSYHKGVESVRDRAAFNAAFQRTAEALNAGGYPRDRRR